MSLYSYHVDILDRIYLFSFERSGSFINNHNIMWICQVLFIAISLNLTISYTAGKCVVIHVSTLNC